MANPAAVDSYHRVAATVRPIAGFALQFDLADIRAYAARFPADEDDAVLQIGRAARDRGHYTREEFLAACRWKTPRSGPLVRQNPAAAVEGRTRVGLSDGSSELERMEALRALRGVEWPTASVLLHLAYPERYPILDVRALHALGVRRSPTYSFPFWVSYVEAFRRLAAQAGVDGRTLDQALWQWSKEQSSSLA